VSEGSLPRLVVVVPDSPVVNLLAGVSLAKADVEECVSWIIQTCKLDIVSNRLTTELKMSKSMTLSSLDLSGLSLCLSLWSSHSFFLLSKGWVSSVFRTLYYC